MYTVGLRNGRFFYFKKLPSKHLDLPEVPVVPKRLQHKVGLVGAFIPSFFCPVIVSNPASGEEFPGSGLKN